jgi:hypothetical protein
VNSDSDYQIVLRFVPEFDGCKPAAGELALLKACISELAAAVLDEIYEGEE